MPSTGNVSGGFAARNRRTSSANACSVSVKSKFMERGGQDNASDGRPPATLMMYGVVHALRLLSSHSRSNGLAGGAGDSRPARREPGLRLRHDRRPPGIPGHDQVPVSLYRLG